MGPQRGQSTTPNRAGGYRPLCPALRASLFDSPGRGFAPPHRFAAVPLPNSRLSRRKSNFRACFTIALLSGGVHVSRLGRYGNHRAGDAGRG